MSTAVWKYSMHSGPIEVMISVSLPTVWNQGNGWLSWCGTPKTYSRPCRRGSRAAMSRASPWPTASTQKSTILPPVSSRTASTMSSREASITCGGPEPPGPAQPPGDAVDADDLAGAHPRQQVREDQAHRPLPHHGAPLVDDRARADHRPQHRGQRLGHDHRGQIGKVVRQPGQSGRLRADEFGKAVVVVGMGQHRRALRPGAGPRLDDHADVLVSQPAGRTRDGRDWPSGRRAGRGPCWSRTRPRNGIAPALRRRPARGSARRRATATSAAQ